MVARMVTVAAGVATQQFLFYVSTIQDQSHRATRTVLYCRLVFPGHFSNI